MQNADAESRRIKMWIDENPGKTEKDYKQMKQAKFQAGLKAMKANTSFAKGVVSVYTSAEELVPRLQLRFEPQL